VASVLYFRGRRPQVVLPEGQEGIWPLRLLRRPYAVFEIQLGSHTLTFEMKLPAADTVSFFPARISVRWQVRDPMLVAKEQVSDVAKLLAPQWEERLKDVSRQFPITQPDLVEAAVRKELGEAALGAPYGMDVTVVVDITPDEVTIANAKQLQQAQHTQALERLEQRLRLIKNENERQVVRAWAQHFQEAMKQGDTAVMAEMMARHRDDIPQIRAMLREEQHAARKDSLELISTLIEGNLLEPHQLGDQAQAVVEILREGTQRAITTAVLHTTPQPDGAPQAGELPGPRREVFWNAQAQDTHVDGDKPA
jgi:hypothetical protein